MFPINHVGDSPESSFVGAIGLRVEAGAISEVGRVRHPSQSADHWYLPGIQRALVIGDRLYTVSAAGVRQSDLGTLAEEAWVPFG